MEEDERSYSGKEELGVVRTRTGREVKRPREYENRSNFNLNSSDKLIFTIFIKLFP
jgi:hypothetical protein